MLAQVINASFEQSSHRVQGHGCSRCLPAAQRRHIKQLTSVSSLCVSEALLAACAAVLELAVCAGFCRMLERVAKISMYARVASKDPAAAGAEKQLPPSIVYTMQWECFCPATAQH